MKNIKLKSTLLPLIVALPTFAAQADNAVSKEELQKELQALSVRLAELEKQETPAAKSGPSATSLSFYGSLRPTFGVTSNDTDDTWDVGDALSRLGFAAEHQINDNLTGFAKGEFKVNIQADGDFGDARLAYVGIKGNFGRVAIGKQWATQYNAIAEPVDIFNRAATPLAYDSASPFRINNLVTYSKSFGNLTFAVDGQFNGSDRDNAADYFGGGVTYSSDVIRVAAAYYTKELNDGNDEKTVGVSLAKSFGPLYLAAAYQDREVVNLDGSTLDLVAAYAINNTYKVKLGVSQFEDGVSDASSGDYSAYNSTLEWQGTPDFRLFVEYQKTDYDNRDEDDQLMVGMRYDFDYKF